MSQLSRQIKKTGHASKAVAVGLFNLVMNELFATFHSTTKVPRQSIRHPNDCNADPGV
jgi:hypothetical protein